MARKKDEKLENVYRIFQENGCKKVSYMVYQFMDEEKDYFIEYFPFSMKKNILLDVSINAKSISFNEFCNYIAYYGSVDKKGQRVCAPYPGHFRTPMSLQLTSAYSFKMYKLGKDFDTEGLSDHEFVDKCLAAGAEIYKDHPDFSAMMDYHLKHEITDEMRAGILLYKKRYEETRALIDQEADEHPVFEDTFLGRADKYLTDLGY